MAPNYQLAPNRARWEIETPIRYVFVDLTSYALNMGEGLQDSYQKTFKKGFESIKSKKWLKVVSEKTHSLYKNHSWESL